MKKTACVFGLVIATLTVVGLAQTEQDYQTWMKSTASTVGSLKKNVEAKMGDPAAADADKLAGIFKQVGEFWQKRGGADDAVGLAQKAATAASAISAAAKAGNMDQASAELRNLNSTCGGCHMLHRERLEGGGFKIK